MKNQKIIDYGVIVTQDCDTLVTEVTAAIDIGWQPIGGVAITTSNGSYSATYNQSMVKYEKESKTT